MSVNIQFCVKLSKSSSETLEILREAHDEVLWWRFKNGWKELEYYLKVAHGEVVMKKFAVFGIKGSKMKGKTFKIITTEICWTPKCSWRRAELEQETIRKILPEDLGMGKISISSILIDEKHQWRFDISSDLLPHLDLFHRIIIRNKTWCFQ